MSAQPQTIITEAEYLLLERAGDQKHEYYDGIVVAQAGGSAAYNRITINTINSLYTQLQHRPCSVYSSDMRVKIPRTRSYVYPDITLVCGTEQFEDAGQDVLLNPIVIIEVLSPSTERHDRGRKFELYRTIPSLQEYLLIAQDTRRIDQFVRQSEKLWTFTSIGESEEQLVLPSIACTLLINAVYQNVPIT